MHLLQRGETALIRSIMHKHSPVAALLLAHPDIDVNIADDVSIII